MSTSEPVFATALNCMDGRTQLPVSEAVREALGVSYVDTITEAGIVKFLSDGTDSRETDSALAKIRISIEKHGSKGIAVAAHHDCAGNPVSEETQREQLRRAVAFLKGEFPGVDVIGLWVTSSWKAEVVT